MFCQFNDLQTDIIVIDVTDATLGARGLWLGTRIGADGTVTLA